MQLERKSHIIYIGILRKVGSCMSIMQVKSGNLNYIVEGNGPDVILLHGWGQNIAMMKPVADHLQQHFRVFVIDFPGFGESDEPKEPWGVPEYAMMLREFIEKLEIKEPILLGHSFGCRVAITYASMYPVKQMLLTGAAGIPNKKTTKDYVRIYTFKTLKHLCKLPGLTQYQEALRQHFGSSDYKNTSGVMRTSFVKIVNHDVRPMLSKLKMPVLLVFGEKDDATPLWMGKIMEKEIPDAGLVVFDGATHYAYLEQLPKFLRICDAFFVKGEE